MHLFNTAEVVSIGRLTAFYVVLVPLELIPSEPPPYSYIIVWFCTLQKGSSEYLLDIIMHSNCQLKKLFIHLRNKCHGKVPELVKGY